MTIFRCLIYLELFRTRGQRRSICVRTEIGLLRGDQSGADTHCPPPAAKTYLYAISCQLRKERKKNVDGICRSDLRLLRLPVLCWIVLRLHTEAVKRSPWLDANLAPLTPGRLACTVGCKI